MLVSGFVVISEYISRCFPDSKLNASSSDDWLVQQASHSFTMTETIKFHDLVFGRELGEGSFSVVKYARHITKVSLHLCTNLEIISCLLFL